MQQTEILNEIIRLPLSERIAIIESALISVRKELNVTDMPQKNIRQQMSEAAEALYRDYLENEELTAFTALDGEEFYEKR
ncbi:MAG: hypothetical protein BWK80_02490 [Desulfobacteraceae bacterium IS3]|jgi:hypothetical protein|nr:MAG: hypothetical protein BWK80_02490 [Desulfobacteraceae bacterium IS3]